MNKEGIEEFVIPVQEPVVASLEQCWEPTTIEGDINFTPEEMEKITIKPNEDEED